jgi:hypothetical protein
MVASGHATTVAGLEAEKSKIQEALAKAGPGARLEVTWTVTRS